MSTINRSQEILALWEREQALPSTRQSVKPEYAMRAIAEIFKQAPPDSLLGLTGLLRLKGKPFTLNRHFPMEPMFRLDMPIRSIWKCGRQVSKSTSLAAQGILMSARLPHFSTVFVTPLYEQIRRFSANYVRPFLNSGLVGQTMMSSKTEDSVLQKTFINDAVMHFTFAYLDCERARGIAADRIAWDEIQDMNQDFLPVVESSLDASEDWGIVQYSGTPKTMDNTAQWLWEQSSCAEWMMKCSACNLWNIPTIDNGVLDMIQPDGLMCKKCGKPLNPADGQWQHGFPSKFNEFEGHHAPQIIFPMHYGVKERWTRLYNRKIGQAPAVFANEVLGESYDAGQKLITLTELKAACTLPINNDIKAAIDYVSHRSYVITLLGVDWGGGGLSGTSTTTAALICMRPDGKIEVPFLYRIRQGYRQEEEAKLLLNVYWQMKCGLFAHDFGGAGSAREAIVITSGLPESFIMPMLYVPIKTGPMIEHRHNPRDVRSWYSIDKPRSLLFMCSIIRAGFVAFPKYESCKTELADLLNLIEDKVATRLRSDIYVVIKNPKTTDDMAHSVNFGILAAFHSQGRWPNLADQFNISASSAIMSAIDPRLMDVGRPWEEKELG